MEYSQNISYYQQRAFINARNKTGKFGYIDVSPWLLKTYNEKINNYSTINVLGFPLWIYEFLVSLGIICNLLTLLVLTRKSMAAPINTVLSALEVVNLIIYLSFFPYPIISHYFLEDVLTYNWRVAYRVSYTLCLAGTTASNWISVLIGAWRFIAVTWPLSASRYCNSKSAKIVIGLILLGAFGSGVFDYSIKTLTPSIVAVYESKTSKRPLFFKTLSNLKPNGQFKNRSFRLLIRGVFLLFSATIPCVISGVFSILLIVNLFVAKRNRRKLSTANVNGKNSIIGKVTQKVEQRLTIVLLVILVISNVAYLPRTVACAAYLTNDNYIFKSLFYKIFKSKFGELLSNCFTFFVYVTMSKKFRNTAKEIVSKSLCRKEPKTRHSGSLTSTSSAL